MPAPMTITPESMQQAGAQLALLGDEMACELQRLQQTITGGNAWGSDKTGTAFGQLYQAVLGQAFTAIESHAEHVRYAEDAWPRGVTYVAGGRRLGFPVEPAPSGSGKVSRPAGHWDDGTPLRPDDAATAREIVALAFDEWGRDVLIWGPPAFVGKAK